MFKNVLIVCILVITAMSVFLFINEQAVANISQVPSSIAKPPELDPTQLNIDSLKAKIKTKLGLTVVKVEKTPVPGIALLITDQGLYYSSYNGDYFIQGKVYSLITDVTDIAEQSLVKMRLEGMEKFKDDMIVYKAKDEKYVVTVFTDITCGYCRKMHKQMDDYNARGITFRYLAYPRSGIKDRLGNYTDGFKDLRSVWCSDDPIAAMTDAKNSKGIGYRVCDNPIEGQYKFGRQVGVNGTPAIILSTGMMVPGYQPPAQLEQLLQTL
ncbi:bifunctional protein-disulfide isomerase/oxidoreductase DsbC [Candidatus Colwellia aromaticivorans]|uniref:bifunctional protein-disulfide isomerase/oxidoreductase DsbC n=1 Tax=Candidatus Colwellia aromaticivorans TaxID=2267621 RepID=UPI000DF1D681|nr:bifunctional protein-disulfide isomerase/oxidoreductase DsbC [Candidatus Colwellia aromaticivorans]